MNKKQQTIPLEPDATPIARQTANKEQPNGWTVNNGNWWTNRANKRRGWEFDLIIFCNSNNGWICKESDIYT